MPPVRDQLEANRELIYNLAVVQKRALSHVQASLEQRGVKTSVPTLSRYVRETFPASDGTRPDVRHELRSPPPLPVQVPQAAPSGLGELVTVIDQVLDLQADLAGKIEGNSRTVTELERYLREQPAAASSHAELASALAAHGDVLARLETYVRGQSAAAIDPIDRAQVRRIWFSAFVICGLVWFAIIVGAGLAARATLMP